MKRTVRRIALAATIAALPTAATPVVNSRVTPGKVVYGDNGVVVTLTKTGNASASATIHSPQGDASAKLTKQ
jgi:hypothetical protein